MNRTIKDGTVKGYHDDSHEQLGAHLADFVSGHNFAGPPRDPAWPHAS